MRIPFVDLHAQYLACQDEFDAAFREVITKTAFIGGEYVRAFEREYAAAYGVRHCISCANGTDAIYIVLRMLGVGPGHEVITTAASWISTSETISQAGARPVFVDVDEYGNIDVDQVAASVTLQTRAIIPVHLYGQAAQVEVLEKLAAAKGLHLIEDCAQAHFAERMGRRVGTIGAAGTFSFYPGKNLGAYGDAGAIITNDDELARRCRMYANHGALVKHEHEMEGINSRLDGLQASLLTAKLRHLGAWTKARQQVALWYDTALASAALGDSSARPIGFDARLSPLRRPGGRARLPQGAPREAWHRDGRPLSRGAAAHAGVPVPGDDGGRYPHRGAQPGSNPVAADLSGNDRRDGRVRRRRDPLVPGLMSGTEVRVVVLSETYAPDMGYLTTMLPRYMAREGADVHLVTLDLAAYHYLPDFLKTYGQFQQRPPELDAVRKSDGYTVHVLKHRRTLGFPRPLGLHAKLRELRPDVVYSSVAIGWLPLLAAISRLKLGHRLFTGSHTAAILFPLARVAPPVPHARRPAVPRDAVVAGPDREPRHRAVLRADLRLRRDRLAFLRRAEAQGAHRSPRRGHRRVSSGRERRGA